MMVSKSGFVLILSLGCVLAAAWPDPGQDEPTKGDPQDAPMQLAIHGDQMDGALKLDDGTVYRRIYLKKES